MSVSFFNLFQAVFRNGGLTIFPPYGYTVSAIYSNEQDSSMITSEWLDSPDGIFLYEKDPVVFTKQNYFGFLSDTSFNATQNFKHRQSCLRSPQLSGCLPSNANLLWFKVVNLIVPWPVLSRPLRSMAISPCVLTSCLRQVGLYMYPFWRF